MRFILAVLLTLVSTVAFAQAPAAKPETKATLSADELEMMTDSVTQLERAATDMQSARLFMEAASAKQERAQILIEARKLKILNARGYSDKDFEVVYLQNEDKTAGQWIVRAKVPAKEGPNVIQGQGKP